MIAEFGPYKILGVRGDPGRDDITALSMVCGRHKHPEPDPAKGCGCAKGAEGGKGHGDLAAVFRSKAGPCRTNLTLNEPMEVIIEKLKVWMVIGFRPEIEDADDPRAKHIAVKARWLAPVFLEPADLDRLPVGDDPGFFTPQEVQALRDALP